MRRRRLTRKEKRSRRKKAIIISSLCLLFVMTAGYAAFQTNLSITAKGNIKNLKEEIDSKVPTNELLFWGQADNEENTLNILKDKSGNNNDGILNGFDNTTTSGYTDEGLVFDGINDFVNIGFANYDFQNSVSYIIYTKVFSTSSGSNDYLFGNWESNGGGILITSQDLIDFELFDGEKYYTTFSTPIDVNQYHTIIGIYDGNDLKLYIDGNLMATTNLSKMTSSSVSILLGANPSMNNASHDNSKMQLKEAMLYDRALTEDEVKTITEGFERKYK